MKQIKFNIMSGNVHCRNINDLKENFNIHDILNAFENGILERWLLSQKLDDICNKVSSIDKSAGDSQKLESLIKIIYEDENEDFINNICSEALSVIDYESRRKSELENINNFNIEKEKIIDSYFKEYDDLIQHIIDNKKNYDIVKEDINKISIDFKYIFERNYYNLFMKLYDNENVLAVISLLANEYTRPYLINNEELMKKIYNSGFSLSLLITHGNYESTDLYIIGEPACNFQNNNSRLPYLNGIIRYYKKNTYKKFVPFISNKKCMILHAEGYVRLRTFINGKYEEYGGNWEIARDSIVGSKNLKEINGKFIILDNIEYYSYSIDGYERCGITYIEI